MSQDSSDESPGNQIEVGADWFGELLLKFGEESNREIPLDATAVDRQNASLTAFGEVLGFRRYHSHLPVAPAGERQYHWSRSPEGPNHGRPKLLLLCSMSLSANAEYLSRP